jgi:hypothetical protein
MRQADAEPCFGYYYFDDLVDGRPSATPLHCVAIDANPETGLILGYVEYFGIHRAVVSLGRDYAGDRLRSVYALDPRTGQTLELAARLDFSVADVRRSTTMSATTPRSGRRPSALCSAQPWARIMLLSVIA